MGCIAGALSISEYGDESRHEGFAEISIDLTHETAEEIFGANIRAKKDRRSPLPTGQGALSRP